MNRAFVISLCTAVAVLAVIAFARPEPTACAQEDGGFSFTSQSGCKKCHFKTHRSWKKTVHAKAMDALMPGARAEAKTKANLDPNKDYTKDADCVACHVTGYGKPGGYPEIKDSWSEDETDRAKDNGGVGCESCHGAGSAYAEFKKDNEEYKHAQVRERGMNVPLTADVCTQCHNEKSPTFDAEAGFDFEASKGNAEAIHEHEDLKFDHSDG